MEFCIDCDDILVGQLQEFGCLQGHSICPFEADMGELHPCKEECHPRWLLTNHGLLIIAQEELIIITVFGKLNMDVVRVEKIGALLRTGVGRVQPARLLARIYTT